MCTPILERKCVMKAQSINPMQSVAFGALRRDSASMSKTLFDAVSETPAVKKFGEKFDATLSIESFYSKKQPLRSQLSLSFEDIKPKSVFEKIKKRFSKNPITSINLKTRATNEDEFVTSLANKDSDSVFKIYNKKPL